MPTRGLNTADRAAHYDPLINPTFQTGAWKSCPLLEWLHDQSVGVMLNDQFTTYNAAATTGDWVLTQATAGTGAISTAAPGVLELDCNSTTQGQGAQIQRAKSAFVPAAGKDIWFETKIKIVDTFDKVQFFAGLAEIDTTIIGSGAISTANHIGWLGAASNAGVLSFAAAKASAATTKTGTTLAEDTYVKLGFRVNGVTSVDQYVNDALINSTVLTANIPIVALYPSFVCQTDGTNDPIMHIAGYRVFQLR